MDPESSIQRSLGPHSLIDPLNTFSRYYEVEYMLYVNK
jgi:hypothetical protein